MITASEPANLYRTRLEIRSARCVSYVEIREIDWIEAADNYVILHTISGSHLMRESMTSLESRLDPQNFLRIHRSTIINLKRVRELRSIGFGDRLAVLRDGTEVRVSRNRKFLLEQSLKQL
jgi:two-component system, LytTR family, response regulator